MPRLDDYHTSLGGGTTLVGVSGSLRLREHGETGETKVGVTFRIDSNWMKSPPLVSTDAAFLRAEHDWHVPLRPFLCHELDLEWQWKLEELWKSGIEPETIIAISSAWCVRNVDSLLTRHLHGHRYGIVKWPKEWEHWGHGRTGVQEFNAFIQKSKTA